MKIYMKAESLNPLKALARERIGVTTGIESKEVLHNQPCSVELSTLKEASEMERSIEPKLRSLVRDKQTFLEFALHEDTGTIMVKVRNLETQEIIREIPPEKILDLVAAIWDAAGLMVDKRV